MIDAEVRSEERFSRLSLAFCNKEEREKVVSQVEQIINKYPLKADIHFSDINDNKAVMVIEYHDDINREAGEIFEEIIHKLDIKSCL
ncbi:hypothetical protein MNB_SM-7-1540 [hydrothermal vent metagenome]|uniref:Uncharacterized protein n=1 Tax=hydrothermal vent metagenome TaxID=652676 RepID=A0A1W1B9S2_9ZZZZ